MNIYNYKTMYITLLSELTIKIYAYNILCYMWIHTKISYRKQFRSKTKTNTQHHTNFFRNSSIVIGWLHADLAFSKE